MIVDLGDRRMGVLVGSGGVRRTVTTIRAGLRSIVIG